MFDEALIFKVSSSQQVENMTNEISQQVEFNVTLYVLVTSTLQKSSTIKEIPRVEEEVVYVNVP